MLAAAGQLSDEQWKQDLGSSFPSIRDTLAHIFAAEWVWLRRWNGDSPKAAPPWMKDTTPETLRAELARVEEERRAFVGGLTGEDLSRSVTYTLLSGSTATQTLGNLLLHAINHSTYHRGQVATMLRQTGVAPPSTDYLVFTLGKAPR